MAHTPGPWVVDDRNSTLIAKMVEGHCEYIANAEPWHWSFTDRSLDESEANASLIAAAPELLDATKCLRQHLALFCTPSDSIATEIFRLVDAAIAKAEAPTSG